MSQPQEQEQKALTWRSGFIALFLVLLWTLACCFMACHNVVYTQYLLMVLGFGAILTIFLLQFPLVFLVSLVVMWGGTYLLVYIGTGPAEKGYALGGIALSLLVAVPTFALAAWIKLRPLRRAELVVIYAAVLIAIPWCICIKAVIESSTANLFELQRRSEPLTYAWARDMPWWGPTIPPPKAEAPQPPPATQKAASKPGPRPAAPAEGQPKAEGEKKAKPPPTQADLESMAAIQGFTQGNGGKVPWKLWWRPMVYWTSMCLAFQAMLMGMVLLFRRRWIEHERLPFVWSQPALHILRNSDKPEGRRRRWLMFAIGLGICLPAIVLIGPAGESLSSWSIPPWVGQEGLRGGFDLTALNLLPKVPLKLFWGPLVLAMLLLFPVDVLMTTALTYILVTLLAPAIMQSMGLQVGLAQLGLFTKWGLRFGGCLGLLVWSAVFAIWDWVRSPKTAAPPARRGDDLPRRLLIVITLAGVAGFILLGSYATTTIQMVCLTGFVVIYAFGQVRQRVEGMPLTYENNIASHQMVSIQRDFLHDHYSLVSQDPSVQVTSSSWATHWMQWGFAGQLKSFGPHNMVLEAFKVAHELRVHARPVAKVILITMLVVAAVTPLLYLKLMYTYGFDNSYQGALTTWQSFTQWTERAASYGLHSTSKVFMLASENWYLRYQNIFNTIYGVAIVGILFYLRREYPRFPLSPVGVVLGAEQFHSLAVPFSPQNIWFTFLAAWVIKSLIFRWLGVRSFREKVAPAAIMILCGMIFGMMMYICRYVAFGYGSLK